MIYKPYGKTGLSVSAVGFGGMQFDTKHSKEENARLVQYAVDRGINYLDTAPAYCDDQSEDIFGMAIKDMASARDRVYISTKAMPEKFDTAEKAMAQVDVSLKRLNVEQIDFYHVWCIRTLDQYKLAMKPGGQYEGLLKCKEQGKIKHIVVSTHLRGPDVIKVIEKNEFDGVLLGANILNFLYRWQGVQTAFDMGLGVVAMNPLAGGVIPQNQERFSFLAGEGETPTEAALRFCISCPQYTVTLNGFTTREHIDAACNVADNARPFTEDDRTRISRHITQNMDKLCTGCGYCMGRCPRDIPISGFMQYYNKCLLNDKTDDDWAKSLGTERVWGILADRQADAGDCIRCGRCEMACTQHLDIVNRLDRIADWENNLKSKEQEK